LPSGAPWLPGPILVHWRPLGQIDGAWMGLSARRRRIPWARGAFGGLVGAGRALWVVGDAGPVLERDGGRVEGRPVPNGVRAGGRLANSSAVRSPLSWLAKATVARRSLDLIGMRWSKPQGVPPLASVERPRIQKTSEPEALADGELVFGIDHEGAVTVYFF